MFIAISNYTRTIDPAEPLMAEHRDWLQDQEANGTLITAGPQITLKGGVVIIRAEDLEQAEKTMAGDPFSREGAAVYTLTGFTPVMSTVKGLLPA